MSNTTNHHHTPVLLEPTLELLDPQAGESYLDLTAGYGGHARAVIARTQAPDQAVLIDRDDTAIKVLTDEFSAKGAEIHHQDFASAVSKFHSEGRTFDLVLMDLGVSSPQIDNGERGFSFNKQAPLDMRMDRQQILTAANIVNEASLEELAQIIKDYGEEPRAKRIAEAIVKARPIATTTDLATVVSECVRTRGKIHPATRTFQALRIAVNDELKQLSKTLDLLPALLKTDGRVAIISFHSLEDRLVKRWLKNHQANGYEAELDVITKKPVDGQTESVNNPRARSAKLRGAVKINT